MQPDTNTTSTTGTSYGGSDMMTDRQFTDYVSDFGGTVFSSFGQFVGFMLDRPLLSGSIIVGAIGAFLGSRLGSTLAMRQRKTFYDQAADTLGMWTALIGTWFSPKYRERAVKSLRKSSRDWMGTTQDWSQTVADRMPIDRIPTDRFPKMVERFRREEKPSAIRQIGYGLSLIPVTLALVRNPLVRDVGFRWLANRIRPRRRGWR